MSSSERTPIVVGNWKLHKTIAEAQALVVELKNQLAAVRDVEIGVAPVYTALASVSRRLEGSSIKLWAQDCHYEERGAFTGAVSPSLLVDAGCHGVIVGHSERRQLFGETDELVTRRIRAALSAGLHVIGCVGETDAERDAGETRRRVETQLSAILDAVTEADLPRVVVAYEPVWAIGTGRTATPAQAQEVHAILRGRLRDRFGEPGGGVRIQYGGSVKPGNAESLMREPDIDGALVGGAALEVESFAGIVRGTRVASGSQMS